MSIFDRLLMQQYTDSKFGQIKRIEMVEGDPVNPEEDVLYLVRSKEAEMPVTDYLFRFDASTLGLNDNEKVAIWQDLSPNGYDLTQANEADQPVFLTEGFNGKPTVDFNSTFLSRTPFSLPSTSNATIFSVLTIEDTASSVILGGVMAAVNGSVVFGMRYSSSGSLTIRMLGNQRARVDYSTAGEPIVFAGLLGDEETKAYKNGVEGIPAAVDGATIGSHNSIQLGYTGFVGKISEFIYFPRALTEGEISSMNSHLITKWGL